MIRIFLGYDRREAIGFHTCVRSLMDTVTAPLSIVPVSGDRRDGTNDFVYSRFLVPHLCGYKGWAIFADGSDMLFREDVAALWALQDPSFAVAVVKHDYKTRHSRKYVGSKMEADNRDYPRKNWSSLMLFNCAHKGNRELSPDYIDDHDGAHLHRFGWLLDEEIRALPTKWNVLIGEEGEGGPCAVAHFTLGIPALGEVHRRQRYAEEWLRVSESIREVG